jgi:hypothetical protein
LLSDSHPSFGRNGSASSGGHGNVAKGMRLSLAGSLQCHQRENSACRENPASREIAQVPPNTPTEETLPLRVVHVLCGRVAARLM